MRYAAGGVTNLQVLVQNKFFEQYDNIPQAYCNEITYYSLKISYSI
jgi:hypothetical protein